MNGISLKKGGKMSTEFYNIQKLEFRGNRMFITIDSQQYIFNLTDISKRLTNASEIEREKFKISPSGYGIHWPLIDEDLSVPGLLKTAARLSKEIEEKKSLAV
jgi:hypothetical protein